MTFCCSKLLKNKQPFLPTVPRKPTATKPPTHQPGQSGLPSQIFFTPVSQSSSTHFSSVPHTPTSAPSPRISIKNFFTPSSQSSVHSPTSSRDLAHFWSNLVPCPKAPLHNVPRVYPSAAPTIVPVVGPIAQPTDSIFHSMSVLSMHVHSLSTELDITPTGALYCILKLAGGDCAETRSVPKGKSKQAVLLDSDASLPPAEVLAVRRRRFQCVLANAIAGATYSKKTHHQSHVAP